MVDCIEMPTGEKGGSQAETFRRMDLWSRVEAMSGQLQNVGMTVGSRLIGGRMFKDLIQVLVVGYSGFAKPRMGRGSGVRTCACHCPVWFVRNRRR